MDEIYLTNKWMIYIHKWMNEMYTIGWIMGCIKCMNEMLELINLRVALTNEWIK